MFKQSDTQRHLRRLLAAAAATLVAGAAAAQDDGRSMTPLQLQPPADTEGESAPPAPSREERLDALFAELAAAEEGESDRIESAIMDIWSRSGSDTMDLLLRRGRDALNVGETAKAIDHFSATVEHAPDFAEGWNMRATAFYIDGEWGLSLADIERTLALEPRHWGALTGLGMILEQLDREADALVAFRAALAVNPHVEPAREAVERLAPRVDGRDI